eukprot:15430721-Alexandrium_andersonii.AAC.1
MQFRNCPRPHGAVSSSFGPLAGTFARVRVLPGSFGLRLKLPESTRTRRKLHRAVSGSLRLGPPSMRHQPHRKRSLLHVTPGLA